MAQNVYFRFPWAAGRILLWRIALMGGAPSVFNLTLFENMLIDEPAWNL